MFIAQIIMWLLGLYIAVGMVFALCFVTIGAGRLDASVEQSTRGFRVMIVPGVMAFWPLLAVRWWRGVPHPPIEKNAHREAAQ